MKAYDASMQRVFGGGRWRELKEALLRPARACALLQSADAITLEQKWRERGFEAPLVALEDLGCVVAPEDAPRLPKPHKDLSTGFKDYYPLDLASVLCASALGVRTGETVLDIAAAPGGKSLVLAKALGSRGRLVLNDVSPSRRARLKQVLIDYLPTQKRQRTQVLGQKGAAFGSLMANTFDRVLADVPCSGDRHLLANASELERWTPRRPKLMAGRQVGILSGGLHALKPGGVLVYATCALSPLENDEVVNAAVRRCRRKFPVSVLSGEHAWQGLEGSLVKTAASADVELEETEVGQMVLPDRSAGWGPLYWCVLRKDI
ncbi:tRNA Cytosine-5--methyltransferase, putative [Hondaea fermentalgiana]|uniref:NOL1/NOP2/Sun domain family member 4 n=1 Tax=Hondaea fermentalgiana TaxID=2315210 RepID=A0A2R5G779_9STRA|nr:tRNA Cytosine-5--methyltransferase, putative [Hondaea fermentalgiana]|eukprot:GBG26385.1 tRNA Cytosine-5--methyltransferase, putative [Hondaea fermentalgiana]